MEPLLLCPDTSCTPSLTFYKTSCSEMIWENGESIDVKKYDVSVLQFICENGASKKMTDYAVSDLGCSIVSERLKLFFDSLGIDNIQYFPVQIIEKKGAKPLDNYYVANIVGLADCIDTDASKMRADIEEGKKPIIYRITNLVLKDCFFDKPILRLAYFTRVILIHENWKAKLTALGIKGIKLISPVRWDGFNGER